MTEILNQLWEGEHGFEQEVVDRYTQRLIAFARQQLPDRVRQRVDPEDIVQSVYRSFFRRLNDGQFTLDESHDVWRLLAAITFCKSRQAVRFHHQARRDVRRETTISAGPDESGTGPTPAEISPGPEDVAILLDSLDQLLQRLPEQHRDVIILRLEGWSIDEIAEKVSRSTSTVLRALARVRAIASQLQESP